MMRIGDWLPECSAFVHHEKQDMDAIPYTRLRLTESFQVL